MIFGCFGHPDILSDNIRISQGTCRLVAIIVRNLYVRGYTQRKADVHNVKNSQNLAKG